MATPSQLFAPGRKSEATADLPLFDWAETTYLRTREGKKLERWGRVKQARVILDNCSKQDIYDLIAAGFIKAYKRRPDRENSHWRVDLLSVWNHKNSQIKS